FARRRRPSKLVESGRSWAEAFVADCATGCAGAWVAGAPEGVLASNARKTEMMTSAAAAARTSRRCSRTQEVDVISGISNEGSGCGTADWVTAVIPAVTR